MPRLPFYLVPLAILAGLIPAAVGLSSEQPSAKSAQPAGSSERIRPEAIRGHVEYLASPQLEGRGTLRGKKLAAEYIRRRFEELRLEPLFGETGYFQEIPGSKTKDGRPTVAGRNIGATLPGSDPALLDEIVIVSAHYDHLGVRGGKLYPGADDNAGSVAMLLEVAAKLARSPVRPKRTVVFLSCDLEENLLWGSRWFVAHPPWPLERVKLFITSEMIGRTLGDLPLGMIFVMGSEHATGLKQIVDGAAPPADLKVAHLGIDLIGTRSDYGPFWSEKVPFLFFSGGEHPDYHQPTDTADRLDYDRAAAVSQLILDVSQKVADADAGAAPQWTDEPVRDLDEVRTLHRITELLLASDDAARAAGKPKLGNLQRFSVSNVHSRTAQILERGEVRADERPWLIRSSQLLLLSVF
ncbi:MAG TPA: M20/M25/M40 family metallo-hydrolase [Planctomycetaceae bacterium]|nr:M20/M25/M40 family metallo-hydrolase [Planctomycetaceae bacterium]